MKLTKREYIKQTNELTSLKADFELQIAFRIAQIGDRRISIEEGDSINDMHDKVYEIQQSIEALDFAWRTRNWNSSDWILRDLITSNID